MRKRNMEAAERNCGNQWCPRHFRLLRSLYGSRLQSLQELLQDFLHEKVPSNEEMGLVRDGDSVEFLTLLKQSFAVLPERAADGIGRVTVGGEPTNQRWNQQQVVERAIQLHLREGPSSNVLCLGYGQVQATVSNKHISGLRGPDCHHLNVATGFISTHLWVTLLARIGEERMLYLLSHAAIFVPMPNYCFLQVAGHPISMAAPNTKQISQIVSTTRKSQHKHLNVVLQEYPMIEQSSSFEMKTESTLMRETHDAFIQCDVGPCDEVSEDVTRSGKRARPSSWVRRKRRRRQGTYIVSNRCASAVESMDPAEPAMISTCTVKEVDELTSVHRVGLPLRLIDRAEIFYRSSFPCHAGLPANHILSASNVNEADISRLLGSIFEALDTTSGEASILGAGKAAKELTKNMEGLLKKLVRNAKRCNYARLLSRHCPLPSSWASPLLEVECSAKSSSLSKEAYAVQGFDVSHLPSAANAESADLRDITTRQDHRKQETHKRPSSVCSQFHAADVNSVGFSKKICDVATTSKPLNIVSGGCTSFGKVSHIEDFQNPSVLGEIAHKKSSDAGPSPDLAKLVTLWTSHSQVVNFLWAVCRSLLPEEFLGSDRFRRTLRCGIASFVSLRRHETFSVHHLLNKLQTTTSAWPEFRENGKKHQKNSLSRKFSEESELAVFWIRTKKSGCPSYRWDRPQTMLLDWLYWLFTNVIMPLLRSHFYITEAENHRQNVLYYRKPVWAKIHMLSLDHLVGNCYTRLDRAKVAEVLKKQVFGFSQIRMLPKHSGVRPIANLSSRTRCTLPLIVGGPNVPGLCGKQRRCSFSYLMDDELDRLTPTLSRNIFREVKFAFKSINSRLKGVHSCLKFEQENHSEDLGASVFGYKDAYVKFLPYVMHLKSLPGGLPPIYMAVCDISRAYDTIKQDKLCEVVSAFLRLPVYHIRRYVTIFNSTGAAKAIYKHSCSPSDQDYDILNLFMDLAVRRSHTILQDQGVVTRLKQGHILRLIEEHVKRNIVKIGPHFYLQTSGIAQGSVISPLLCSVFFGHLDAHILMPLLQQISLLDSSSSNKLSIQREVKTEFLDTLEVPKVLENDESILLRLIDDSIFISTSQSSVARFVQLMHDGFEEYGCFANQQKTSVSFDMLLKKNQVKKAHGVYVTNDEASFMRWSGLLINCCTLEVQADYTRYIGEPIKGCITVVRKANPGAQVLIKLCHFVRARCHPMLYDLRINSPSTIRLNAYQAFLLCAMKFHAYLCSMERFCRHHPPFLLEAIEVTSSYMHGLLRKQMQEMGDTTHLGMTKEETTWLALHAFLKVLNKKQSRYVELLFLIQDRLGKPKYRFLSQCPHLTSARDEKRSTMFKSIRY